MQPLRIRAVFVKEVRDALRDRRTIFATIFVPILLWPVMLLGLAEATQLAQSRIRSETYTVAVPPEALSFFERIADEFEKAAETKRELEKPGSKASPEGASARIVFRGMSPDEAKRDLENGNVRAVVVTAGAFEEKWGRFDQIVVEILYDQAEQRSQAAMERIRALLDRAKTREIERRLTEKKLKTAFIKPLEIKSTNIAPAAKVGGSVLGTMLPLLFIMMIITGAMHPAIDMTAGEKERSTLETLIGAPVRSIEIIMGKFLAVSLLALGNGLLNVASFGFTFALLPSNLPVELSFPWAALPFTILVMIPLALFFSALLLAVSSFGANQKEAQIYCLPIYLFPVMGTMLVSMPGIELSGPLLFTPVINTALLIKELFLGRGSGHQISFVFISTCLYAGAAVAMAARVFAREEILFSAQGSLRLFLSRRFFKPSLSPRPGDALLLIAILFPINFFFQLWLQSFLFSDSGPSGAVRVGLMLAAPQWILFFGLPVLVSLYLKTRLATTFQWQAPPLRAILAGIMIGGTSWLVVQQVISWQSLFWPYNPGEFKAMEDMIAPFRSSTLGILALTVLIGVFPGFCEEHLFRGFFLQGLRPSGKWTAILLSGIIFGVYHMQLFKQPILIMLGCVFAYLAWQSRSVWPSVIAHMLHNGLQIIVPYFANIEETPHKAGDPLPGLPLEVFMPSAAIFLVGVYIASTLREQPSGIHESSTLPKPKTE